MYENIHNSEAFQGCIFDKLYNKVLYNFQIIPLKPLVCHFLCFGFPKVPTVATNNFSSRNNFSFVHYTPWVSQLQCKPRNIILRWLEIVSGDLDRYKSESAISSCMCSIITIFGTSHRHNLKSRIPYACDNIGYYDDASSITLYHISDILEWSKGNIYCYVLKWLSLNKKYLDKSTLR